MLFDWEEDDILADYGPYISAHMEKALEKNRNLSGGTVYGYGFDVATSAEDPQSMMYTWDLRFDLYQELGCPEIKNYDDMVDVLKKMKEICPTDDNGNPTYGVSLFNDWDGNMVMYVKSTASAYMGGDEFGFGLYDPSVQQFIGCLEPDGPYLESLAFYNKLYRESLLDPDSQTQGYDGMNEDYLNGTAFLNVFNFMGSALYNTPAHLEAGKIMYPVAPSEATPIRYGLNVYGGNRIWSIGANTEHPELCMAIYNWLATPEGRMTAEYGPADLCWYYDEEGYTHFTELGAFKLSPGTTYSEGVRDTDLDAKWSQVAECIKTNTWKAIYAESEEDFAAIVEEMTTQAKEYGYDECVEWCVSEAAIRAAAEDAAMADE